MYLRMYSKFWRRQHQTNDTTDQQHTLNWTVKQIYNDCNMEEAKRYEMQRPLQNQPQCAFTKESSADNSKKRLKKIVEVLENINWDLEEEEEVDLQIEC